MNTSARVRLAGTDLVIEAHQGEDLREVLERVDCPVLAACGGTASCGQCLVHVLSGGDLLSSVRAPEATHLTSERQRLACQARVRGVGELVVCIVEPGDGLESK